MNKKKLLMTMVIICFTGLNFTVEAGAQVTITPPKVDVTVPKVTITTPKVKVAPVIYRTPLARINPGYFYFYTKSPASITIQKAKLKGYKTNLKYLNKRWVVRIWKG
jgi:hypothetical protein